MNPNNVSTSTHVVHILAAAGSLILLIGSAGQAWDSLNGFQAEFQRLAKELGDSFIQRGGLVVEVGRRLSEIPLDEIVAGGYVFGRFYPAPILRGPQLAQNPYKRWRPSTETPLDTKEKMAERRLHSLLRTAIFWAFIMVGAIAAFTGATIDLVTSW